MSADPADDKGLAAALGPWPDFDPANYPQFQFEIELYEFARQHRAPIDPYERGSNDDR